MAIIHIPCKCVSCGRISKRGWETSKGACKYDIHRGKGVPQKHTGVQMSCVSVTVTGGGGPKLQKN